jgi:Na+/H+ antiporter NhaD/arsenite permease-like protein
MGVGTVSPPSPRLTRSPPHLRMSGTLALFDGSVPTPLSAYPPADGGLLATWSARIAIDPFNLVATVIFFLAILHTFVAPRVAALAHRVQDRHDARARAGGASASPSVAAELLHFVGEVEVVFGLWALVLLIAITLMKGWEPARHYFGEGVNYTEALFVVVIMALSSTRPIVTFAEGALRRLANIGGATPAAWWITILTVGPLLGSLITEPGAMTICALLLARQFYDRGPSPRLRYATLGLLFVNVSIGGTLTPYAAPPVLMVARPWGWDFAAILGHVGWRAAVAIVTSTVIYYLLFRPEMRALAKRPPVPEVEQPDEDLAPASSPTLVPVPAWVTVVHVLFLAWTVITAHEPALFVGGFLFFLGFVKATAPCQSRLDLRAPLLVGFFLAGLVTHGGLQAWWIAPLLGRLSTEPLYLGATILTGFNDNALITYLATLVPDLSDSLRIAIVQGAVTGGGLTVIANAPNPAGQALLNRFFADGIGPLRLFLAALLPTLVAIVAFRLL